MNPLDIIEAFKIDLASLSWIDYTVGVNWAETDPTVSVSLGGFEEEEQASRFACFLVALIESSQIASSHQEGEERIH